MRYRGVIVSGVETFPPDQCENPDSFHSCYRLVSILFRERLQAVLHQLWPVFVACRRRSLHAEI
jgi:hypothetical protein